MKPVTGDLSASQTSRQAGAAAPRRRRRPRRVAALSSASSTWRTAASAATEASRSAPPGRRPIGRLRHGCLTASTWPVSVCRDDADPSSEVTASLLERRRALAARRARPLARAARRSRRAACAGGLRGDGDGAPSSTTGSARMAAPGFAEIFTWRSSARASCLAGASATLETLARRGRSIRRESWSMMCSAAREPDLQPADFAESRVSVGLPAAPSSNRSLSGPPDRSGAGVVFGRPCALRSTASRRTAAGPTSRAAALAEAWSDGRRPRTRQRIRRRSVPPTPRARWPPHVHPRLVVRLRRRAPARESSSTAANLARGRSLGGGDEHGAASPRGADGTAAVGATGGRGSRHP